MDAERQVEKIKSVACLEELQGFEEAAKARGILPEELRAIQERKAQLTPKRKSKRLA